MDHKIKYFTKHIDCLLEIKEIQKDWNRNFVGRGKSEKGFYVVYCYR